MIPAYPRFVKRSQKFLFKYLLLMVIPLVVLFLSQRFFMQDMVIASVEK